MSDRVTIPIPGGLMGHGGIVTEVVLKPPTFDDYLDLGDPVTIARAPDGSIFSVENGAVIRLYIQRCLVAPTDVLLLAPGGMKLARALKDAVLGFFRGEPSGAEASKTSPTTSSSEPAKDASTPAPSGG